MSRAAAFPNSIQRFKPVGSCNFTTTPKAVPTSAALAILLSLAPICAQAQTVNWNLVAGEAARFPIPELPVGNRDFNEGSVSDFGLGQLGFRVLSPSASAGYWASQNGVLVRYTQLSSSGIFGPGRTGPEATHHFSSIRTGQNSTASDGQRAFLGKAGDPANTTGASNGVWRWNGAQNIEIARGGVEGLLGPGLAVGWSFENVTLFVEEARMLQGGQVLVHADVTGPGVARSRLLARHVPGVGNQPCMRVGFNTEAGLSPGLEPGDRFQGESSTANISAAYDGRVYIRNTAVLNGPRLIQGIWRICDGAPRAQVVIRESGPRGPDIGIVGAQFENLKSGPLPDRGNGFYYFSEYCRTIPCDSPIGVPQVGLFHTQAAGNLGVAYNEPNGFHGPNWQNSSWKFFDVSSLSAAGQFTSFVSSVSTLDGIDPTGLWRIRSGQRPELAAMINSTEPAFAPEAGRTWAAFTGSAVFGNGDIVVAARTNPGNVEGIWLLPRGGVPRKVLAPGQVLTFQTINGPVQETVRSFTLPVDGGDYASSRDSWVAADGTLLMFVGLVGDAGTLDGAYISTRLNVPDPLVVFADGFE